MKTISQLALSLAASICLVATVAIPAVANAVIRVHNASGHCAAVTLNNRSHRFIEPGTFWSFSLPAGPEVRVRAEILDRRNCTGRTIGDAFAVLTDISKDGEYAARIEKDGTGYRVVIHH